MSSPSATTRLMNHYRGRPLWSLAVLAATLLVVPQLALQSPAAGETIEGTVPATYDGVAYECPGGGEPLPGDGNTCRINVTEVVNEFPAAQVTTYSCPESTTGEPTADDPTCRTATGEVVEATAVTTYDCLGDDEVPGTSGAGLRCQFSYIDYDLTTAIEIHSWSCTDGSEPFADPYGTFDINGFGPHLCFAPEAPLCTIEPSCEGPVLVVHSAGYDAGWIVVDHTKQWLSADCRSALLDVGQAFMMTPWNSFASLPATTTPMTCDEVSQALAPVSASQLVVHSESYSAGWVLVDGTKQWLSSTCRDQLENAGATFELVGWDLFGPLPPAQAPLSCDAVEAL